MRLTYVSLAFAALLVAACGGKVAIDQPSAAGGAGGTGGGGTTTTTSTTTSTWTTSTSTSTSTSSTSTGIVTGGCGHLTLPAGCGTCATNACCSELIACDIGTTCWNQLSCLVDCGGDPNCGSGCTGNFDPALDAFAQCLNDNCSVPGCSEPGPGICDSGLTAWQGSQCGICLSVTCCSAYEACAQDPLCFKCMSIPNAPPDCFMSPAFASADTCKKKLCPHACP